MVIRQEQSKMVLTTFITVKNIKDDCLYDRRLSNGMIEGYNTTIEQLQFNAKGYSNFLKNEK